MVKNLLSFYFLHYGENNEGNLTNLYILSYDNDNYYHYHYRYHKGGNIMEMVIVYGIGALACTYFAVTIWKQVKGQGSCACSSGGGCSGCSANNKCKS